MKIRTYFSCLMLFAVWQIQAQEMGYFKQNNFYDIGFSSNGSQNAIALNWNHLHGLGKAKKFRIGYGLRFTSYFGGKRNFITAPSKLTTGSSGPEVIFKDNILANFDTISLPSFNVNTLNASIHLNYAFNKKIELEFNIDAIGFTFGSLQTADYNTSKRTTQSEKQKVSPTFFNALLMSDNDLGSLNSEILIKYWFKPQWAIKLGATFIFSEYTTTNKLYLDNDRFRNKSLLGLVGISYSPNRLK